MRTAGRAKVIIFLSLGVCLAAVAVAVGSGWIILNWREGIKVFLGVIFFGAITAGLILNTSFLVREIRRNEQHDSFINAVTHELKTPLASIRLYLQTLQRREVDEAQRREFYRCMLDDTDRLLGTVEQVLKAGEASHQKARRPLPVDFGRLVGECVEVARNSHHLPPDAVRYEPRVEDSAAARVAGDSEELRAAVSNLLDNAIKYSGERVEVSVRVDTPDAKRITLRVQDNGVGIPAPELKRIFRRFYRVPNRTLSTVKGTGLGLFIVRAIVRKHGGRVFAESLGEGRGTTVVLELPRERGMSRVLIVEDEAHLANGLQYNLEAEGHSVAVAGDGETALQLLLGNSSQGAAGEFDAVVLDVMLPGKDGFAVATELRAAKQFVPVLMLTARGRPEDVLKGFASGADDYLPKPFELAILLARLQGLLRRREWMRQSRREPAGIAPPRLQNLASRIAEYDVFSFHGRSIDFGKLELEVKGNTIHLTLMEAELLRHLIRNSGRAVSRKSILEQVWGLHEDTDTRAIDNFIVRLRRYIEDDPSAPQHLVTVRGVGYRFVAEPE